LTVVPSKAGESKDNASYDGNPESNTLRQAAHEPRNVAAGRLVVAVPRHLVTGADRSQCVVSRDSHVDFSFWSGQLDAQVLELRARLCGPLWLLPFMTAVLNVRPKIIETDTNSTTPRTNPVAGERALLYQIVYG
jgi:hypothetical protein